MRLVSSPQVGFFLIILFLAILILIYKQGDHHSDDDMAKWVHHHHVQQQQWQWGIARAKGDSDDWYILFYFNYTNVLLINRLHMYATTTVVSKLPRQWQWQCGSGLEVPSPTYRPTRRHHLAALRRGEGHSIAWVSESFFLRTCTVYSNNVLLLNIIWLLFCMSLPKKIESTMTRQWITIFLRNNYFLLITLFT